MESEREREEERAGKVDLLGCMVSIAQFVNACAERALQKHCINSFGAFRCSDASYVRSVAAFSFSYWFTQPTRPLWKAREKMRSFVDLIVRLAGGLIG